MSLAQLQRNHTAHILIQLLLDSVPLPLPHGLPLGLAHLRHLGISGVLVHSELDGVLGEDDGEDGEEFYLGEAAAEAGAVAFGEGDVGAFGGGVEGWGGVWGAVDAEVGGCLFWVFGRGGGGGGGVGSGIEEPALGFEFFEVVVEI